MKELLTSAGFKKLSQGHPWVRKSDLKSGARLSKAVSILQLGEHWFLCDPKSAIPLRRLGPWEKSWAAPDGSVIVDEQGFRNKFTRPLFNLLNERLHFKRTTVGNDSSFRWIFSEMDYLPGLIVDIFGDRVVLQINHPALALFRVVIEELLETIWKEHSLDLRIHDRETATAPFEYSWNGFKWLYGASHHQKTGGYLDQRTTHLNAANWARQFSTQNAWDLFCFEGGFSMHLAASGVNTLGVDSSSEALKAAETNRSLNLLSETRCQFQKADIMEFLNSTTQSPDLIVLDPPSLASSLKDRDRALKYLYTLHLKSLSKLPRNRHSLLVSCTCSHHIRKRDLLDILTWTSHRLRIQTQILQEGGASPDHAALPEFPEGEYLNTLTLAVRPGDEH